MTLLWLQDAVQH